MVTKTPKMQVLEYRYGRDIKTLLDEYLRMYSGQEKMLIRVAVELDISEPTLRSWCESFDLDVNQYRNPWRR